MPDYLPDKYESGTMNLPGIIGLHAALTYLEEAGIPAIHQKKMKLTGYFLKRIQEIPQAHVAGKQTIQDRLAVVSLDFPEYDNAAIAFSLEQDYGIMTRVGLHCAPVSYTHLSQPWSSSVLYTTNPCSPVWICACASAYCES